MTTPTHVTPVAGAPPPMTPERWRAVDAILQAALAYEPERRDAVVADACDGDEALRSEVASLLSAHRNVAAGFLERPAAELLGAPEFAPLAMPRPEPRNVVEPGVNTRDSRNIAPRGRTVSARAALYAAVVTLVLGLAGGLLIDRSSLMQRWADDAPARNDAALAPTAKLLLTEVNRGGRALHAIPADRPWTPRYSPDGHRVAYGAFGEGRTTSDLWVTDLDAGTTRRLTDDGADANDPQWSADGASFAYSVRASRGKDLVLRPLEGGTARTLASRNGTQFPSDWLRDGSALLVTEETERGGHDILVQPADGSAARPYAATSADETAARISPDGRWVAYTSDVSGRAEVYLDSYPQPGRRVVISSGGGVHPVWRGDGRELYYWRDGALVAVPLGAAVSGTPTVRGAETVLFSAQYHIGVNTMYDVSPDGQRFVIIRQP